MMEPLDERKGIGVVTQTTTDFFHQCTIKIQQLVVSTPPEVEWDVSCCDSPLIFGSFVSRESTEFAKRTSLTEENSTLFVELLIYAKTHSELILSTLIQWRKQQQITLASTLSIESPNSKQKSLTSKKPLELLYDERKYDAIEFVFYKVSFYILKHSKSAVSSTIYDTLDSLIIDYLKLNAKGIIVYKKGVHSNKKIIEENISDLIGEMSFYRLPFIASKYFSEISSKSDFVNTNICIIESIRSIQLSTNNVESLKDLITFVEYILANWKILRGKKEQKHICADILASIFRPLIDKTTSLFDTSPLLIHFGKLSKLASSISKKSNGPSIYLMSVCLALSDSFEDIFWKTLDNFTKQVDLHSSGTSSGSSGNTSSYVMDSIYSIIVGYFNKIGKDNDKVITNVSNYLKQKQIEFECLDVVIDIIHLMSTIRFGYVIENVIFDFVGSIEQSNKVICGVLSWMRIVGRLYHSDSSSLEDVLSLKSNIITFVSKKKVSPLKRRLSSIKLNKESRTASLILRTKLSGVPLSTNTLNDSKDINELQSIYLPRMSTLISNLVNVLDSNLGDYVSYNNNPSIKKELEMKDKEKLCHIAQTVIHMIMHTVVHLPILNASNFRILIQSMLKFSYHVHEGICLHASDLISVLSVLPDFRPILINEYTNFLFRLPNEYNYLPLKRLNDLLWQWKLSPLVDPKLFDPYPLEAVLLTMSCIDKETRVTCIQLLGMISDIIPSTKSNPAVSNRLYDFLLYSYSSYSSNTSNSNNINASITATTSNVEIKNEDDDLDAFYSTNISSSSSSVSSTTAETLLNSLYKEEEVNYCIIVSKLMQFIKKSNNNNRLLLCKMVFQIAYHRVLQITQTNQIDKNNINLFRNLLILCNATALDFNAEFSPFPEVSLESYCKDIVAFYMKQEDILPLIQMGLPYLHHSVSPLILSFIDGFNEVKIKKKATAKQQNNTIMMVHAIIDSFPDGLLIKDHFDTILTKALLYIQRETEYYLDLDLNSVQLNADEISARSGLTQIISKILLDINIAKFKHDILSQNFRSKILKFLESCCSLNSNDLQFHAMGALAQLVGNVYFHEYSFAEEKDSILTIINNFFTVKNFYDVTKLALQNYLSFDHGPIQECVVECYSSSTYIAQGYFLTLLEFITSNNKSTLVLSLPTLLHLVIYIVGHPSLICRENGSILVSHLSNKSILKSNLRVSPNVLSEEEYCTQQYILSYKLATLYPELTKDIIIEWITRFKQVESIALKNQMLNYISGWINNLVLDQILKLDKDLLWYIIEQLLLVTHFYGSSLQYSVNNLWTILVKKHEDNVSIILDIVLYHLSHKINKDFFQLAKKIIVVLYRANSNKVISILFHEIYHKCSGYSENTTNNNSDASPGDNSGKNLNENWIIEDIFKTNNTVRLSKSQVSMILLVDLILERELDLLSSLPKLIHISILYLDSPMPIIHKHSRQLLINILFKLQAKTKNTSKLDKLSDKLSSLTAPSLDVKSIVDDLIDTIPMNNLLPLWIQEATSWLSNSSNEFVQQSIKIYHSLFLKTRTIDKRSIMLLLNSLSHFLKKRVDSSDTSFTIEFIELVQSILITVDIDVILSFPQLIHTLCYMLFTTNQKEFAATCNALSKGISRIGPSISGLLLQNIHESNNISYSNILACILKGLSRESTYNITIQLLQEFLSFEKLDLDTLFILLIGLVPYIITNEVNTDHNKLVNLFLKVLQKKVSNYKDLKIGSGTANSIQSKLSSYSELLGSWYFNEHNNSDMKQVVIEDLSNLFDLIFFPSYSRISYMYLFEVLMFNSNKNLQKVILSLLTEFVKNESVIRIEKGNVYHKLYLILKEHVVTSPLSKEWIHLLELVLNKCNSNKKEVNDVDTKHLQHFDVEKWWTPSETMRKYLVSNLTRVASSLQDHEDDSGLVKK